ncbi:ATP-binding cassette domain-containing protein [Halovenus sp. WSH3]|uniref:ATP-binding cassette domain-containing protein n=1 Tax=Halovenus carboxidivorans TaxID=2692199 RepID=A0A6B0T701_9EURY|nr:ABC transporter ATP-binding protein [Halovenus carboxidivorans]MXR51062.1 ATP-binding cassette domain-containing protein [Halovenus carboxidivorans]
MPVLQLEDVDVSYGKTQALRNVSLEVEEGEIVGVIGPNGAGKTTMLDSIAGYKEYSGSITYDGTEVSETSSGKLVNDGLVYCTEDRDLFPYFTVHENLQMGAQFRSDDGAVQESFDFVYDLFPRLDERRDQEAQTMSGGEQQMLALGRALMSDPDVLMLDEPTLGLAPVIIDDISEALERLQDEGLTILLVEQNSTFALRHAERLYLLEQGSIELSGTADELRDDDYIRDAYVGVT